MNMQMILAVGFGGALGAIGRYLLISRIGHMLGPNGIAGVPIGILAANVLGSLAMGLLTEYMALAWSPPPELRALMTVGVLGAFTTFSTFALEAAVLLERGAQLHAAVYIAVSVGLSLAGLFAGLKTMRWALT